VNIKEQIKIKERKAKWSALFKSDKYCNKCRVEFFASRSLTKQTETNISLLKECIPLQYNGSSYLGFLYKTQKNNQPDQPITGHKSNKIQKI